MKISEIMTPTVLVLDDNASLTEAAQKMKKLDVGFLVVTARDSISGLLTDRDIVVRGIAEKKDLNKTKVRDIMSQNPVTCDKEDTVEKLAQLFSNHKIRRVIVTDRSQKAVGIVSLGDLAVKTEDSDMFLDVFKSITEAGRAQMHRERKKAPEASERIPV
ncbi:CBS domain-containing protein [Desulfomonile tiedjei]|uniref:Putative signal-transduction protein containing cAMP-binding and CBS domains n=1 Tax=Desulfomonile tiedjei (strain ATCC 49306 / DSM 6799 / DCB-1) TaxID=706587 RepID=I4C687_DESTA|nr:CBS domain-containing protein [Desulfomonile tiedjei]AFM25078.1 putative signal-transduction protein containing cAMP-binding and CBS domains [Desulfomonile tiedjei DSM 6799]